MAGDGGRARPLLARLVRKPLLWAGLVVLGLIAVFAVLLFQPFAGDPGAKVIIKVPKGATFGEIADLLDEKGVISSATLFEIRATLAGRRNDLQAGSFVLAEGMSYVAVLDELRTPEPARTRAITIPEGLTREQIADLVRDEGLEGSYVKATEGPEPIDPRDYGAESGTNLEGFLFPSTYELKPNASAEDLVEKQIEAFKSNLKQVDMSYAESKNLTPYDVLIIASMIDKEIAVADERELASAVIYNRLEDGEPLGIDATIRYAVQNYDQPLLESELAVESPYNTRTNAGLPPTPIDNPGLASIEAAANPADVDYRYYVVKPGTCGEHVFVETAEEFDAAVTQYNDAREAAGGRSPVEC